MGGVKVWILKFSNTETLEDKDTNIHLQKHKTKPVCYQMTENPSPHPCPHPSLRYFPKVTVTSFPPSGFTKITRKCVPKKNSAVFHQQIVHLFSPLCSHTQIQILMWALYSAFSFHFSKVFWILLKTSKETVEWQPELLNIRLCGILVTPKIWGRILKTNDIFLKNASALLFF